MFIAWRGRLVHLFEQGDYKRVELSQPKPLSHIYGLIIIIFVLIQICQRTVELDKNRIMISSAQHCLRAL